MSTATSYWCYRCSRLVRAWPQDSIVCPDCDTGFLEEVSTPPRLARQYMNGGDSASPATPRIRRQRRAGVGDRSPFNPVIVLRGQAEGREADRFELYYDDGAGSGLRPLPPSMSEFLMGSGFDRLLDQLAQIEINGLAGRRFEHPPASKAAIESMPTVEISASHVGMDCHCTVCMEAFEIGGEAKEMPCKHIYHKDCILPWLSIRNSCPICRHQMPADQRRDFEVDERIGGAVSEDETVGLTIWRLPRGGFAIGRLSGGGIAGERQLPVVYTEMDGGFNSGGAPRRISWNERERRDQQRGGIGSVFRNFFSFFGRRRRSLPSSSSSSSPSADSVSAISERRRRNRGVRLNNGLPSVRQ